MTDLRYHPDPDQFALAEEFGATLADVLPIARLHQGGAESAETWAQLEALGLFGLGTPEEGGGSGLGAAEEALIAIELGRGLAAPGVLATIAAAHLGAERPAAVAAAYRSGDRVIVVEQAGASAMLLHNGDAVSLHPLSGPHEPVEPKLWRGALAAVAASDGGARLAPAAVLRARLVHAAALAGMAQAAQDMGVAYAAFREQFGRPIGSFQAIKHRCADMAIATRCARDQVSYAATALDDGRDDAALQVESALLTAGRAALDNAAANIQVHGGIGFSDEADPHLVLKRARLVLAVAGGLEGCAERIAAIPPMLD